MKVLILDDSTYIRNTIKTTLTEHDFEVVGEAANGEEAIDMALELNPDVITLDNILPDMTGIDILRILQKNKHQAMVIMISAIGLESTQANADELGVHHYLIKPIDHNYLVEILQEADSK